MRLLAAPILARAYQLHGKWPGVKPADFSSILPAQPCYLLVYFGRSPQRANKANQFCAWISAAEFVLLCVSNCVSWGLFFIFDVFVFVVVFQRLNRLPLRPGLLCLCNTYYNAYN